MIDILYIVNRIGNGHLIFQLKIKDIKDKTEIQFLSSNGSKYLYSKYEREREREICVSQITSAMVYYY